MMPQHLVASSHISRTVPLVVDVLFDRNLKVNLSLQWARGHHSVEVVVHHHGATEVGLFVQHDSRLLDVPDGHNDSSS